MKILVSACLLGENCKYSGGNNYNEAVAEFVKDKDVLPICPEMLAGMGCPRTPIEIVDGVLMDRNGNNVDVVMREAVEKAMEMIRKEDIQCAVLQSRSPTCGVNQIYDGSFSGKLIPGSGVLAQALKDAGYHVIDSENMMALRKALADYTANAGRKGGEDPTVDKQQLIERVAELIEQTNAFLQEKGFSLDALVAATDFAKQALVRSGANAVCDSMETKKEFQTYASELARMMKYLQRSDLTDRELEYRDAILAIYRELQTKRKHADNTDLMVQINGIISENLTLEPSADKAGKRFDISKIDFDLLHREFAKAATPHLVIKDLTELVAERIKQMLACNPQRLDYYDRYQTIIQEYNDEKNRAEIERIFDELMKLANDLDQEQKRYVREGFSSDEELSMFDLLCKPDLTKQEIATIKKIAVELLTKVKARISELDHCFDKAETKANVQNLILNILWTDLPECYEDDSITTYRERIYEYFYMRYKDAA